MSFPWSPDEDAILSAHIAGKFDLATAYELLSVGGRTYPAVSSRASRMRISPPASTGRPNVRPSLPRGMTADQVAWARANPGDPQSALILGWAQEGPVLL